LIRIKKHREIEGVIKSATITMECDGKYYISILCNSEKNHILPVTQNTIGIDLGIKKYATLSNGKKISNPKILTKSLNKLVKEQRELSHTQK